MGNSKTAWQSSVMEEFNVFIQELDVKLIKVEKERGEYIKISEIETSLAQEIKTHKELLETDSLQTNHLNEYDALLGAPLMIKESDQERLDTAKNILQVVKEITGVRPAFDAPDSIVKGYIKSRPQKMLLPFEFPGNDSEALWSLVKQTATPGWPMRTKSRKEDVNSNEVLANANHQLKMLVL